MKTVLFYEETEPLRLMAAAYSETNCQWKEAINKQGLEIWLKEAFQSRKINKNDQFYFLIPETAVFRQLAVFPQKSTAYQRRKMAENILMSMIGERPGALRVRFVKRKEEGKAYYALCGIKKSYCNEYSRYMGQYSGLFQWASITEWQLLSQEQPISDGYYAMEAALWTTVTAVAEGQILNGRTTLGHHIDTLYQELCQEMEEFSLPHALHWYSQKSFEQLSSQAVSGMTIAKVQRNLERNLLKDKWMIALLASCLVLPGILLLGGNGQPDSKAVHEENSGTASISVEESDYRTLITQAYAEKSDRIVLLNHQAADHVLAISGRCAELLDLADYMKHLDEAEMELHPILLDMVQKTKDEKTFYEFVVQISLKVGEGQ